MIIKNIKLFTMLLVAFMFNVSAHVEVVQGPFKLKGVSGVSIRYEQEADDSISFLVTKNKIDTIVDSYEVGDGVPKIDSVFFSKLNGVDNIITLISSDEENVNAIHYKILTYSYSKNGIVKKNESINRDKNLEGYDGYNGSGAIFNLKDAASIKMYLRKKHN